MPFRVFQYPLPTHGDLPELNAHIGGHRVAAVSHYVVSAGGTAMLVFVVETVGSPRERPAAGNSPRVDYRESMTPQNFATYCRLRDERKRIAEAEGVPVYTVFSNAQLAAMVERKAASTRELAEIEGVGAARVEKYGARMVEVLLGALGAPIQTPS